MSGYLGSNIAKSATEAKYLALSLAESELRSMFNILDKLFVKYKAVVQCNNMGTKIIAEHSFTKGCCHIDIAYCSLEDSVAKGIYQIEYIPGTKILADLMTKSLPSVRHHKLFNDVMNCNDFQVFIKNVYCLILRYLVGPS